MVADKRVIAAIAVVFGACLFGFLGVASRYFHNEGGLNSLDIVAVRFSMAAICLLIALGLFARKQLRISLKDIPFLLLFGIFKLFADLFFIYSQNDITLCLASLLQLTAPYYVMFISFFIFKERITVKKMVALGIGSIGCVLVTGVLFGNVTSSADGIIAALASGLFYGMFMIGNKVNMDRGIAPAASLFYTLLFADLLALPFINMDGVISAVSEPTGLGMAVFYGLLLTVVPFYLFVWSMRHLEPTIVTAISVMEVVASTVVGFFVFDEVIRLDNIIGMALVILSIIILNIRISRKFEEKYGVDNHLDTEHVVSQIPLSDKKE